MLIQLRRRSWRALKRLIENEERRNLHIPYIVSYRSVLKTLREFSPVYDDGKEKTLHILLGQYLATLFGYGNVEDQMYKHEVSKRGKLIIINQYLNYDEKSGLF